MRPLRLLLQDISDSIAEVISATPESLAHFKVDKFRQSHILRHIQIIGEAVWRLPDDFKMEHPEVPWRLIAGMRHVLVHDYFAVNWDRVYETAKEHVPALNLHIQAMLNQLPPDPS